MIKEIIISIVSFYIGTIVGGTYYKYKFNSYWDRNIKTLEEWVKKLNDEVYELIKHCDRLGVVKITKDTFDGKARTVKATKVKKNNKNKN